MKVRQSSKQYTAKCHHTSSWHNSIARSFSIDTVPGISVGCSVGVYHNLSIQVANDHCS